MLRRLIARFLFYPTLVYNVLACRLFRLWHWWDCVDEHVLLGALPFASDVPALSALGVKGVVNTCLEYAGPTEAYQDVGIVQLYLPTTDYTWPSREDIERGVEFINQYVQRRQPVYVHCKAGRGRSATVVLCWLISSKQLTPEQAQAYLKKKRPQVSGRLYRRAVVRRFYADRLV